MPRQHTLHYSCFVKSACVIAALTKPSSARVALRVTRTSPRSNAVRASAGVLSDSRRQEKNQRVRSLPSQVRVRVLLRSTVALAHAYAG